MGLFTNKNHEKRITELERFRDMTERCLPAASQKRDLDPSFVMSKDSPDVEKRKLQAAYALNLCTVSVSQIIDYDDLIIMDQEYEMILNNLNLENMPSDEAFLNIFKQLLDTITFFRIQEGDKKRMEEKYKQKMKNAIWSAVPNFSVIMTGSGGNPYAAAAIAAVQVGIGYMNYRKAKAEIKLEQGDEEWKLQRTAIDQLNGLRRELFDTAWRISAAYNFPDEYRLTEKQISQFNDILMDSNSSRKYDRLNNLKEYFKAYPPFWYYLANSAYETANSYAEGSGIKQNLYNIAKTNYEEYLKLSENALLREDNIVSACCLEYAGILLNEENRDVEKIKALIDRAYKNGGKGNDVIQTCAITYLGLGCRTDAQNLMLYLFNEGYNRVTNAQILSSLYVQTFVEKFGSEESNDAVVKYRLLQDRINENYLCPMPTDDQIQQISNMANEERGKLIESLYSCYLQMQKIVLSQKFAKSLEKLIDKYVIRFNKCIPLPDSKKGYSDSVYLDTFESREERYAAIWKMNKSTKKWEEYTSLLQDSEVFLEYIDILNDMIIAVFKLDFTTAEKKQLKEILENEAKGKQGDVDRYIDKIGTNKYKFEDFKSLFNLGLLDISKPFWEKVLQLINKKISAAESMEDLYQLEFRLMDMCLSETIPSPEYLYENNLKKSYNNKSIINPAIWGESIEEGKIKKEILGKFRGIIKDYKDRLILPGDGKKEVKIKILDKRQDIHDYLVKEKEYIQINEDEVAVVIDDWADILSNRDIIFTIDSVHIRNKKAGKKFIEWDYDKIRFKGSKFLSYTDDYEKEKTYTHEKLDMQTLYNLIEELSEETRVENVEQEGELVNHSYRLNVNKKGKITFDASEIVPINSKIMNLYNNSSVKNMYDNFVLEEPRS